MDLGKPGKTVDSLVWNAPRIGLPNTSQMSMFSSI
jgi:hypothetical protein